ncbi:MAG: hypothetical protein UZ21_OP11001000878 [Microgenomates bacterium OLB22]|nr:MAG: hypothetical protein UZ21_OP11001000878 [Microgenomates bacterium OLB22]
MAVRKVIDCDRCERLDLKYYATLRLRTGSQLNTEHGGTRDTYATIHICTQCCERYLKEMLNQKNNGVTAHYRLTELLLRRC